MRVLVTGSSGKVGSAIAGRLSANHEIIGLDLTTGTQTTQIGTIEDRALVFQLARNVQAIIHVAALHVPDIGKASTTQFAAVNVMGTRNLLEAALAHGVDRFIYSSSTSVYGAAMVATDRAVWVTEDLEPQPRDIYDWTKLEAEALCREAANTGMGPPVVNRS